MARAEAGNCMAVAISVDSPGNTAVPPHSLAGLECQVYSRSAVFSFNFLSPRLFVHSLARSFVPQRPPFIPFFPPRFPLYFRLLPFFLLRPPVRCARDTRGSRHVLLLLYVREVDKLRNLRVLGQS